MLSKHQNYDFSKLMCSMCQNLLLAKELAGDRRVYGEESMKMEELYSWEERCYVSS